MKTNEELNALGEEVQAMSGKMPARTEKELELVNGGISTTTGNCPYCHKHVTITVCGSSLICTSCSQSWQPYC